MKTIPDGWVKIATYDSRENKCVGGPTGDYARILQAIKADPPLIRAYKDGKFWVANQADIDEFLAPEQDEVQSVPRRMASPQQTEAAVIALCEINNGISLIHATLERLTLAVESMATQPATHHDRLVASVESNGFHN